MLGDIGGLMEFVMIGGALATSSFAQHMI